MKRAGHQARALALVPLSGALLLAACGDRDAAPSDRSVAGPERPSLLLVTLDTTRADHVAPEAAATATPALAALAARSLRFTQAYATAPATLPSHASMLTGLYPAGHGLHENGRRLADPVPLVTERLRDLGYATAAFVSGYPLERQFGLERGFARYDDAFGDGRLERPARETTDRALAWLATSAAPRFLWVHYYDPHEPYAPPEPFRSRFPDDPYRGEIAAMDQELGRLLAAFEGRAGATGARILVAADHGEGRGDHGEMLHGNLLYQGVMRVPLLLAGPGLAPGVRTEPVSLREVRATLLSWAGDRSEGDGLLAAAAGPVLGEAMQPFLAYRWQPQVMGIAGRQKLIRSGRSELYDVVSDPAEAHDLAAAETPDRALARAVAEYPLPEPGPAASAPLDDEARRRLASLGYIASAGTPTAVPPGAPRAADMTRLFPELDAASRDFVAERYAEAAPRLERILAADPGNLMTAVRLGVSRSLLGRDRAARAAFETASRIDPDSIEVQHYLAMHDLKSGHPELAAPLFEQVLAVEPDRLAAIEGLARARASQGRLADAASLLERSAPLARDPGARWAEAGLARMELGQTELALQALESARDLQGPAFHRDLELGVLYLAEKRFEAARDALDRVPPDHPAAALALFKRAQVSVLLNEPDREERIRAAWERADPATRGLIEKERLFAGLLPR